MYIIGHLEEYRQFFSLLYLFSNVKLSISTLLLNADLKGLSHEIDFKNVDSNLQNLA